jgi:hypothetical protein
MNTLIWIGLVVAVALVLYAASRITDWLCDRFIARPLTEQEPDVTDFAERRKFRAINAIRKGA